MAGLTPHVPKPQRGPSVRKGLFHKDGSATIPTGMSSPAQPGKPWNRTITAGRATCRKSTTAIRRAAVPVHCERGARQTCDGSRA
jgi:hypothetical protein